MLTEMQKKIAIFLQSSREKARNRAFIAKIQTTTSARRQQCEVMATWPDAFNGDASQITLVDD